MEVETGSLSISELREYFPEPKHEALIEFEFVGFGGVKEKRLYEVSRKHSGLLDVWLITESGSKIGTQPDWNRVIEFLILMRGVVKGYVAS